MCVFRGSACVCAEDQYVCVHQVSCPFYNHHSWLGIKMSIPFHSIPENQCVCVCSECYQHGCSENQYVCVFAAPVGDGGSGGWPDGTAAGDEGFLPSGTWRTVSGLHRPGAASAEGPPCPEHRTRSVTPHLGLGCGDYSVMWSFTPSTQHGQWHLTWVWVVETIVLCGPSHPKHGAWSVTPHLGLGCADYSVMWSFTPQAHSTVIAASVRFGCRDCYVVQAHSTVSDTLCGYGVWRPVCGHHQPKSSVC